MRIRPGEGVDGVALGQRREDVEAALGRPDAVRGARAFHHCPQAVVVDYDDVGTVELIEVPAPDEPAHQVLLDDVVLTGRALDEVRADLEAVGHTGRDSDIGVDYPSGFAIWSMGSRTLADVDPSADADDDRAVVEGVSVARPSYFGF